MKIVISNIILCIYLFIFFAFCGVFIYDTFNTEPQKQEQSVIITFDEQELTIYQIASMETGCPEWVLVGLRYAESSFGKNINHPDKYDTGDFGLHEKPSYRAERVAKWGGYNPYCPLDSAIVAGHIIMEHYEKMGDMEQAISAYRHGRVGTYRNGIDRQYVSRVKYGWSLYCSV